MQILYIVLIGVAATSFVLALYLRWSEKKYFAGADVAVAEVIGHQSRTDDDNDSLLYSPLYRYKYNGVEYQGESISYSSTKRHEVGQIIPIYVQRHKPHKSILKGRASESPLRVFFYVMMVVMGSSLFLLASFAFVNSFV